MRHFAFLGVLVVRIQQADPVARQRPAHRAWLDRLAGRIADLRGGLGLAVAVADGQAPGRLHLLDDLRVQRLAGAAALRAGCASTDFRSSWMNMRHTVGGAHSVVTLLARDRVQHAARVETRPWLAMNTAAPAFQGAKKQLQACLAQPGEETFRCTSPGCSPSQYIVDRCPTG